MEETDKMKTAFLQLLRLVSIRDRMQELRYIVVSVLVLFILFLSTGAYFPVFHKGHHQNCIHQHCSQHTNHEKEPSFVEKHEIKKHGSICWLCVWQSLTKFEIKTTFDFVHSFAHEGTKDYPTDNFHSEDINFTLCPRSPPSPHSNQ
jgi:hypothetical protein